MIFQEITIKNFRGIKRLELSNFSRVNVFVGTNNSGKTSVLEAIFLATGLSNPQLALTIDNFRDLSHDEADDFRFIFYDLEYKNQPLIEATLFDKSSRSLNIKPTLIDRVPDEGASSTNIVAVARANGLIFDFTVKEYHSQRNSQKSTISFNVAKGFQVTPPKNYQEKLQGVFIPSSYTSRFRTELNKRLEKIILDKEKEKVIEILKIIDPSIKDLIIGTGGIIYFDIGINQYIPSNIEGEGINRLLSIIINLFYYKNGIVFIDEIENGFHYKVFESAWLAILGAATKFNVQLFISTHNNELLQALQTAIDNPQILKGSDSVSAFNLFRNSSGDIDAVRYDFLQFENAINKDIDIR